MMRRKLLLGAFLSVALSSLWACGTSPSGPSPVNLAGSWSGTLASRAFTTLPITVALSQDGGAVTGSWSSALPGWSGTVSGTAGRTVVGTFDATSFTGEFGIPSVVEQAGDGSSGH